MRDRQSRQKNVIIFKAKESNTNLIEERTKSDKELISKIIDEMNFDTEQIHIEKAVRLGRRPSGKPSTISYNIFNTDSKK